VMALGLRKQVLSMELKTAPVRVKQLRLPSTVPDQSPSKY